MTGCDGDVRRKLEDEQPMAPDTGQLIRDCASGARDRYDFWISLIGAMGVRRMLEIGIYRGDFAEKMLHHCEGLETYYMLDPWRNLDAWDKPANVSDEILESLMQRSLEKTGFAANRRVVLRGTTTEVIDNIPEDSLDLAYIDGDHTLKGIAIDLIRVFPKTRTGGFIGGDDFCTGEMQHFPRYEPTLVFPFAVYFAEAVSARIYALPHDQFLIEKTANGDFELIDLAGKVAGTGLKDLMLKAMRDGAGKT